MPRWKKEFCFVHKLHNYSKTKTLVQIKFYRKKCLEGIWNEKVENYSAIV